MSQSKALDAVLLAASKKRLLKKGKDSFCRKVFEKEWNKCKIPGIERESSGRNVF